MSITTKKIRGRIVRIVNASTVVINLGSRDGIESESIFSILGQPESILDPSTGEDLGNVTLVKGRLKSSQVSEKFTIASSKWVQESIVFASDLLSLTGSFLEKHTRIDKQNDDLRVQAQDLQPWKATSEEYVRVGDEVEVAIKENTEDAGQENNLTP